MPDCDTNTNPGGEAQKAVMSFTKEEGNFYKVYRAAWLMSTENGFDSLKRINEAVPDIEKAFTLYASILSTVALAITVMN
jgi:hypothetical protein